MTWMKKLTFFQYIKHIMFKAVGIGTDYTFSFVGFCVLTFRFKYAFALLILGLHLAS